MARAGILFILVGPSAAGKNTLMDRVMARLPDLRQLPTVTTRDPRPGEIEGVHHYFVDDAEFRRRIDAGDLVEYTPVHNEKLYGTPRYDVEHGRDTEQDLIADIEFLGAGAVRAAYPDHTVLVFVTPSNLADLADRIRQRGQITSAALVHRLARARYEMAFAPQCDYVILNNLVEPAAEHLHQIVLTERARRRGEPISDQDRLRPPERHVTISPLFQREGCLLVRDGADHVELPAYTLEDLSVPPHAAIEERLHTVLGHKPHLDAVEDNRFEFVPPYHVDVGVIPHDVYLNFYYRCYSPAPVGDGWSWKRIEDLVLPTTLARRIRAADAAG